MVVAGLDCGDLIIENISIPKPPSSVSNVENLSTAIHELQKDSVVIENCINALDRGVKALVLEISCKAEDFAENFFIGYLSEILKKIEFAKKNKIFLTSLIVLRTNEVKIQRTFRNFMIGIARENTIWKDYILAEESESLYELYRLVEEDAQIKDLNRQMRKCIVTHERYFPIVSVLVMFSSICSIFAIPYFAFKRDSPPTPFDKIFITFAEMFVVIAAIRINLVVLSVEGIYKRIKMQLENSLGRSTRLVAYMKNRRI